MEEHSVLRGLEGRIDVSVGNPYGGRQLQVSAGHSKDCLSGMGVLRYSLI